MDLRRKAFKGVYWSAIQNWGSHIISLMVFLVLARLLKPEAFGLVALASVFIAFVQIFIHQGFSLALVQQSDLQLGHLDTAFWVSVLIGGIVTAIGIAFADLLAAFFHEPRLTPVIQWLSLSLLFGSLSSTPQAILQRRLAFRSLAIRSLVAAIIGGAVGLSMAKSGVLSSFLCEI